MNELMCTYWKCKIAVIQFINTFCSHEHIRIDNGSYLCRCLPEWPTDLKLVTWKMTWIWPILIFSMRYIDSYTNRVASSLSYKKFRLHMHTIWPILNQQSLIKQSLVWFDDHYTRQYYKSLVNHWPTQNWPRHAT